MPFCYEKMRIKAISEAGQAALYGSRFLAEFPLRYLLSEKPNWEPYSCDVTCQTTASSICHE
jgi:hypothetical protein